MFFTLVSYALKNEIIVVSDDNYPPYIFRDVDGRLKGIIVDQWNLWEKKTGIKVNLIAMDWGKAQQFMNEGKADVIDTVFKTSKRELIYDFTKPYADLEVPVFFNKNISGITDVHSLEGFTIGVKDGDACIDVLKSNGIDSLKIYDNYESIVIAAEQKKLHVFCIDKPPALYYLYKYKIYDEYHYSMNLYTGQFHRAVKKGDTELLQEMELGFSKITPKEYHQINEKWMGKTLEGKNVGKYLFYIIIAISAVALLMLSYSMVLRSAVNKKTFQLTKLLEELQKSEAHNTALLNANPDLIFLVNKAGVIMDFRSPDVNMLVMKPDAFLGKNIRDLIFPSVVIQNFQKNIKKTIENGIIQTYEYEVALPDGQKYYEARFVPYEQDMVMAFCRDITDSKNVQTVIHNSRETYELIIDNINDGFFDWNIQTNDVFFSPQWRELLGSDVRDWEKKVHPDDLMHVKKMIDDHIEGILPFIHLECRLIVPDLSIKWLMGRARIVKYDQLGKPLRMVGTFTDITENKRIELALRESEQRFRELADLLPQTIYETDKNGRITFVNKFAYDLFGYTTEDINKGLTLLDVVDDSNKERALKNVFEIMNGANNKVNEYILIDKNKKQIPVAIFSVPIVHDTVTIGMRGIIVDISERKKYEKELQNAKDYLKTIINSVSSPIISADADGNITETNKAAEDMSKIQNGDVENGSLWDRFPCLKQYRGLFTSVVDTNQSEIVRCEHFNGALKSFYRIFMYPLQFEGNRGAVVRIDDITDAEKKDEQLRQAQKMETIGTLAGGLAHDFNNQLGGIIGSLSLINLMLKKNLDIEKLKRYISVMDEAAHRASDMVQQLLTLSRKKESILVPVDLNTIIDNVMRICMTTFDKSIDLNIEKFASAAVVNADPGQLEQVLLNICVNAMHSMTIMREKGDQGGVLSVKLLRHHYTDEFKQQFQSVVVADYYELQVSDTGVGIPSDELEKIFDPFFTTKDKGEGTGLGLTMAYNIIAQHNGLIDVHSEIEKGSLFSIYLPVLDTSEVLSQESSDKVIVKGEGLILIIDDELIMRQTSRHILEECGYSVLAAPSGEQGIALYKEKIDEIAAVLLDLSMPKMSGKDTFIALKSINPAIKVLLISGYKQDQRVAESLKLGVNSFLQKPFTIDVLSKRISELLKP